jgi:hypothetical protein
MSARRPVNYEAMTCAQLDAAIQRVTDQIQPGYVGRSPWLRAGDHPSETGTPTGHRTQRDRYLDLVECRARKGCR